MKRLVPWFSAAALLVVTFGTLYTVVQQAQRLDANYPQVQLAEDVAASLDKGANPNDLVGHTVDMRASLASFIIIYDKSGQVVGSAGSGYLDSRIPAIPQGVLRSAEGKDYHSVTWQPASGVRIAAVAVSAKATMW